jgi:hypothetical protein
MTAQESVWARLQRVFFGERSIGKAPAPDGTMHFEILLEGREPIDAWMICTVCLSVDRAASVSHARWRCGDCGAVSDLQQPLPQYLDENSLDSLDRNLREWGNAKGVRPAYKMLKSARFKCLMKLSRRRSGGAESAAAPSSAGEPSEHASRQGTTGE